ncbi:Ankyrin repeat containing protein [Acanthamoeba castellanii str. Neff]|uniref:Ankyrin repeat containing protein n=1 Tax=Acanthamoeba castellanii (strain ATCC 30010 / Neff) TaxID=1257118 RepID=L8H0U5_ACACF|nr:Ankyrin repeat containing protein [Acanthamoeba castellanii str. Neff]ELR18875.1 Ankyrin repeat containing protein [Acanthamoeba castellanii str. Neff]
MLKRSISTGQLTTLIQTEVDALEGELDQQRKLAAEPNAPPSRANDLLTKSFEEVLRDQYSFIENDEDYAAQILGVADDRVEEGRRHATPTAATRGRAEKTVQEAKETKKEREAVAELLRVLKAGEGSHEVGDKKAKEVKVEHSYFVGWLQKARIFCRLDRAVQQQPQANIDIFDDLLAAETLDYGKEALGYYQKCISLLPHLAGLTAPDLKQAKVYLFSELGQYYQGKGMYEKALQVAVTLLSENRQSQEMQQMLRDSVTVLRETADANQAAFIISTISKLKSPIDACVDFISATYMQLEPLLQRSSDPTFIQARISIVNWYKLLLSEARVKRQCSKPPLSVSLRLSSGIRDEGVKVVDHTQESLMMDLLLGYREHDHSPEVSEAAKLAIEQVAEFTLDIIEEGYEHVQAGTEEAEGHVISIQVHMESLVQRCSYFQTMLSLNMVEKQTQRMRVVTSQPYVFLDMIDYLYRSEVEFESFDHALAVYMVANQYGVAELKELASNFLSTSAHTYAAEIESDWAKFKEVYYLADTMNLPNLKAALMQHLTTNQRWLNNLDSLPPFGSDMQHLRDIESHFPDIFARVSNDGLIKKIQSAAKHDQLAIAEFLVDLLTKRKRGSSVPWYSSTSYEPAAGSQEESVAATVDAQGMCSECRIVMGHLTTCSMFKNFSQYTTTGGGFVPEPLLLSLLEKANSVAWNDLVLKLLRSGFCAITPSVLAKPAEANDVALLGQLIDILAAVYTEEDAETPGEADGDDVSKGKGKEKLRDHEEAAAAAAKEEVLRRREGKWQWEGDSSDWHDYDETANQLIEAAYASGAVMTTLTHGYFAGGSGYTIMLDRQKQRNNATNFERNIRRHDLLPGYPSAAAAPLVLPQEPKRHLAMLMNAPIHNGKTLLITFIEKRIPLSVLKRFLALGKDSGESVTALALAIQSVADAWNEADELISLLLALGADPNLEFTVASLLGTKPSTPLLQAIKQNNFELVQRLVSAVATLYSPEEDLLASLNSHADRNPLFAACFGREESERAHRPAAAREGRGRRPARPPGDERCCRPHSTGSATSRALAPPPVLVLPNAASATTSQALDASVVRGNTPLMAAAFYGRADLVQLLLNVGSADQTAAAKPKKAKGKEKESDDEPSPRPRSARPPVSRACDVGARNWWHWSPLHFASSAGHEEVVRLLCQAPGAIDSACVVSSNGIVNTARQMAADRQFNRVLSLLCALPEDPVVPSLASSQGSGAGGENRNSSPGTFQHSAELAPLQTFTSVSALGGGATTTAVSTLSGSGTAKSKRRLWDRLKFL